MLDTGKAKRRLRASEWYLRHPARQDVLGAAWAPGRGEVVPDPTDPDVYLLNTWRPWPRTLEGMGVVTRRGGALAGPGGPCVPGGTRDRG
jgi:hypothetical protein